MKNQGFAGMFLKEAKVNPRLTNKGLPDHQKSYEDTTVQITGSPSVPPAKLVNRNKEGTQAVYQLDGNEYVAVKGVNGKWYLTGEC